MKNKQLSTNKWLKQSHSWIRLCNWCHWCLK